jgi:hypothetical protein
VFEASLGAGERRKPRHIERRRRGLRISILMRHVRRISWIVAAVFAALLFFAGGAFLRLLMGPISLGPLAGAIEDSINRAVTGFVVRFDSVVLEWSRADGKVYLTVLGTKVFDPGGRIIAQAPAANLDFDTADLLAGHLSLRRFALVGVQLTGVRTADGVIKLGFALDQDDSDLLKTIREMLQSGGGSTSLESLSIRNARVAFRDEPTGLFVVSPDTNFVLESKDGLNASVDSVIEISGVASRFSARAKLRDDGLPQSGRVEVQSLSLPALVKYNPTLSYLQPFNITSNLAADFELGQNGELHTTSFHVDGTGTITGPFFKLPLRFDRFDVDGSYDAVEERIVLSSVAFQGKPLAANGKASFTVTRQDGTFTNVSGEITAQDIRVALLESFREELTFAELSFKGEYDAAQKRIALEHAAIKGPEVAVDLSGAVTLVDGVAPGLTLNGTLAPVTVRDILYYWPIGVGVGAESWIRSQVLDGRVGPVHIEANFEPGVLDQDVVPEGALLLTFPFESVSVRYLGQMTPLTGARGEAQLTGDAFRATVQGGSIGAIAASQGDLEILDYNSLSASARIKVRADGQVPDMLGLIDQDPLGYTRRFRIDTSTTRGSAVVNLDLAIPLLKDVPIERVGVGVQANLTDLSVAVDERRRLENTTLQVALDKESLTSQGAGELSGVPVSFRWLEDFNAPAQSTRIAVAATLDDESRAKLGLSEPTWLKGSMPVQATFYGQRFELTEAAVNADLTQAAAEFAMLNLAKRAGTPATGSARVHFGSDGIISVTDLAIAGEGLEARGSLSVRDDGRLIKVSLTDMRAGPANDFAIDVEPMQGGGLDIRIQGRTLDATKIFGDGEKENTAAATVQDRGFGPTDPLSVSLKVDQVLFKNDLNFHNVSGLVSFAANERITGFYLDMLGPSDDKITGSFAIEDGIRKLSLDATDAGAFIRTFTGFPSIRGGSLNARISFPFDDGPKAYDYMGTVTLNEIVVTDQPFLARLFAAGSLDGPLRLLQGEGIRLTRLNAPFTSQGRVITFDDGRASGPSVGGTFEGILDRRTDTIGLTGTMVPAYGINSMLGAVPILGELLVSKKGEGIFGVTYSMKGPLDDPTLTVNPLSVLTPGILRRIFEFAPAKAPPQEPEGQEPQPAPP